MLSDKADKPYFLRKVIRNPMPRNIMTWTSWNTKNSLTTYENKTGSNTTIDGVCGEFVYVTYDPALVYFLTKAKTC